MALPTRRFASADSPAERSNPFREFSELQSHMERLLENVWSGAGISNGDIWSPPVDLEETDDAWVIDAELPGVKHDDVDVEVRDSELVISGEIKERERKGILRRSTRRTGKFEYRVTLPGEVDSDKIDASLDGGILTIRVPKVERTRPRHVEVKSGRAR
jgi:HSP20 family protein